MASTLTWHQYTNVSNANTASLAGFFADLNILFTATGGNASFNWQIGAYQNSNPYYLTLVQKGNLPTGGNPAPVIMFVGYTGAPAGNNPDIFDTTPVTNAIHVCYFPSATTSTPSNLSSASGAVMGSDTNCIKAATGAAVAATMYPAGNFLWVMDSVDAVFVGVGGLNATKDIAWFGAGLNLVDYSGNAYASCFTSYIASGSGGIGINASSQWIINSQLAGALAAAIGYIRSNYGTANSIFYNAWGVPGGGSTVPSWVGQSNGSTNDIMVNFGSSIVYFAPIQLIGLTKGQGVVLKFRQMGYGPETPTTSISFYTYYGTGNVAQAICGSSINAASTALLPWFTNFQI